MQKLRYTARRMRAYFSDKNVQTGLMYLGFVMLISYFTYVHGYSQPPNLYWDENYHVASAQKYLNGVFFMEPHPPLGKLMIALGEKIVSPNEANNQFLSTDYGRNLPDDFSFAGYRLMPTLLAWLIAPMLFAVFWLITKNYLYATLFSFLYVFDNAMIVHQRGAMLESCLLFFTVAMILLFLLILEKQKHQKAFRILSILFGVAFAGLMTTKVNGLVMILLYPALLWKLWPNKRKIGELLLLSAAGFAVIYVSVWQIHFALGSNVNEGLSNKGYYQASAQYKQILQDGKNGSLLNFPVMFRDSMNFLPHYQRGVPKLDLCKGDENGSPWFLWPIGARSINYRWETPDGYSYRYLFLQSNPVIWAFGLFGVILSVSILLASLFLPLQQKLKQPYLLVTFTGLYVGYMGAMSMISRVMYLYHYFVPLVFSFIMLCIAFQEIRQIWKWPLNEERRSMVLLGGASLMFLCFQVFRPLTYYEPLTNDQFQRRNWVNMWDLKCVKCEKDNPLVQKSC